MKKWNVKWTAYGTLVVEAEDEEGAIKEARQVWDDVTFGFAPDIDGSDLLMPEPAANWEQLT